jgi:hypothetical protein
MAEEQSRRPYRASEPPLRSHAGTSNNDPLAELARLIGQTDPFGEFGRDTARRSAAPVERADWNTPAPGSPYAPRDETDWRASSAQRSDGNGYYNARDAVNEQVGPPDYDDQSYGRQSGGQAPARDDLYQPDHEARGYPSGQADHQYDTYEQDSAHHLEDEYYDQAPSSRRRLGVMAVAGVFALALIGTAGAFGYRALFGSSGSTQPPPVIKADAGPSKVVPATNSKDAQSSKLITERVNERGQSEKLVSREEQPIDKPTTVVLSQVAPQSAVGSGVVGSEPKKVRTIAIRPDQPVDAQAAASLAAPAATRAPQAPAAPAKPAAAPARPAENMPADADSESVPAPAARSASVRQAMPSANAPLSLNADASPARAQARPVAPPTQTAAVTPQAAAPAPAASNGGSGSFVQISSQRSEAEAQAAFRGLQAKFPTQLGSRELQIRKADLGAKGTYYRAMVGPFVNPAEAAELCSSLKAAGGQCFTLKN